MRDSIYRLFNGIRKVAAGLRPFSESVWPGVRNDLFVAHESIYAFSAQFAVGEAVLDAGCGTGYGSHLLAQNGARSVLGIDLDKHSIAFAQRRYTVPNLRFSVAELENLAFPKHSFGFVIASNSLEHLTAPHRFIESLRYILQPGGRALIAVPPIYSEPDLHRHGSISYHRSNLTVGEWTHLIPMRDFSVSAFLHCAIKVPNFSSHQSSSLSVTDFTFAPVPVDELTRQPSITVIFSLQLTAA